MKNHSSLGTVKLCLLGTAFLCTVAAAFMPYSVEIWLCVAAVSLAGYVACLLHCLNGAVCLLNSLKERKCWLEAALCGCVCLSVLLTIILLIGHKLALYTAIEALNLLVIAAASLRALIGKRKPGSVVRADRRLPALCLFRRVFPCRIRPHRDGDRGGMGVILRQGP